MNLQLNDVQQQLLDSLSRLLGREYNFEKRQQYVVHDDGHSSQVWGALAGLGVPGAAIAEEFGGFGGDAVDQMLISRELGRVLSLEPYHGTAVMAGAALAAAGSSAQKARLLPRIAQGDVTLAWAHGEAMPGRVSVQAASGVGGWALFGSKPCVVHGAGSNYLVVSAQVPAGGAALFLVDGNSVGVQREGYRLIDGTPAADVRLDGVQAELLDGEADGAALRRVLDAGINAACAEMVGAMQGACDLTVDYLKTRKQFGKLIGSNQALQHRAVDMLVALEQSRSLSLSLAVALAGRNDLAAGADQVHAAKAYIGRAARQVTQEAIQMHGGIGMTEEYAVGHYLRRVLVLDQLHGDTQYHMGCLEGRQYH
ncbi:acyl-CoA dehydrogenase [Cupriavidus sp. TA19]|uniref:acyl-CoA dehydrogenase family protein n=1 Tax=unclassified Cupriavidus TaxID=2640874 RepID=UPI000E2FECA1|nr:MULTISPECIES: acyl-CoA dehydrogenase family protein [unclassified Cupriavidus]BDB27497.1 acyl-CoA dehydrogenase family protein [Cupriavidus sp. P-10]GLC93848.1 acyl-CoA dehydrogenase [Cupriavidus sp. TA19]